MAGMACSIHDAMDVSFRLHAQGTANKARQTTNVANGLAVVIGFCRDCLHRAMISGWKLGEDRWSPDRVSLRQHGMFVRQYSDVFTLENHNDNNHNNTDTES